MREPWFIREGVFRQALLNRVRYFFPFLSGEDADRLLLPFIADDEIVFLEISHRAPVVVNDHSNLNQVSGNGNLRSWCTVLRKRRNRVEKQPHKGGQPNESANAHTF